MKTILQLLLVTSFALNLNAQNKIAKEEQLISGIVLDEDGNPFPDVNITVKNQETVVTTDIYGNYSLTTDVGKTLAFNFNGYETKEIKVLGAGKININMELAEKKEGEVVTLAMGLKKKKDKIGHSYKEVNNNLLTQANNPNAMMSLDGKVTGLDVIGTNNNNTNSSAIRLRGDRSLRSNNNALVVIDGVISTYGILETLDPYLVESVTVLKGANGAALYGSQGSNGVVVVKTKRGNKSVNNTSSYSKPKPKLYNGKLSVDNNNIIASYIQQLSKSESNEAAYNMHLEQKDNYRKHGSYNIDTYNYFKNQKSDDFAAKLLAEILKEEADNYEMLKGLSFQLEANKDYKLASSLYKRLVVLKPEIAQSYLDLASIYIKLDKNQKAFDILNNFLALTTNADGLNTIVKNSVNSLIQANPDINTDDMESFNKIKTDYDLRIVASWNRANVNVIMQVIEPSKEYASQENRSTQSGGELNASNDSYGPEEYTIRNAKPGEYYIRLKYSSDEVSDDDAIFVKLNIYKNFGKRNQKEEVKIIKLNTYNGEQTIAKIKM